MSRINRSLNQHRITLAVANRRPQLGSQVLLAQRLLVFDPHRIIGIDRNDDHVRVVSVIWNRLYIVRGAFGLGCGQVDHGLQWGHRCDHEEDQQEEHNVNHRRHVDQVAVLLFRAEEKHRVVGR